jgi:uncharacterized membrane protein
VLVVGGNGFNLVKGAIGYHLLELHRTLGWLLGRRSSRLVSAR